MVQVIKTYEKTLTANQTDIGIKSISVPKGEKWIFNGISGTMAGDGILKVYLSDEELITLNKDELPDANHPAILNWEAPAGTQLRIKADDKSGSNNRMQITIYYEKTTE